MEQAVILFDVIMAMPMKPWQKQEKLGQEVVPLFHGRSSISQEKQKFFGITIPSRKRYLDDCMPRRTKTNPHEGYHLKIWGVNRRKRAVFRHEGRRFNWV